MHEMGHLENSVMCRDLTAAVKELLGVQRVWCDNRTEQANQSFVLWAGHLLEER